MPITVTNLDSQGLSYPIPFIGPVEHTAAIDVHLPSLTTAEVDSSGVLKPGIPLTKGGLLLGSPQTKSTPGSATAGGSNTGNGVMGAATGGYGAPAETITLTVTAAATNAGSFRVDGTQSGLIGTGTVGVAFTSPVIAFTLADGSSDFAVGDKFTWTVTAGTNDSVYGVTYEAQKVAAGNDSGSLSAAGDSGVVQIAVATIGQVHRAVAEDVLGRSLTAAEVAGFAASKLVLVS